MQQLAPKDAWFLYADRPASRQAFISAYAFFPDPVPPTRDEIVRWFASRVDLPLLRQRIVRVPLDLDHPYLVEDPDFALSRHLHFHDAMGWDDLRAALAGLAAEPMDQTKPLWELHVVDRVDGFPGRDRPATVAAIKLHHAMADGIASSQVTTAFFGATADAVAPDAGESPGARVASGAELVGRAIAATPRTVLRVVSGARQAREARRRVAADRERGEYPVPPLRRPRTVLDGPIGPARAYRVEFFSLSELQEVKARLGEVTVNDVVLSIVGGAMRGYLAERGESVDGSLAAGVPMTVRFDRGRGPVNNQFVMMSVDLGTDIADPVERLRHVHRAVLGERSRMRSDAEVELFESSLALPGWMFRVARRVRDSRPPDPDTVLLSNTFVTSVPRRTTDLQLCGARAEASFGLSTLDGSGTSHSVGSTGDVYALNITADPLVLRDPARYAELIRRSYDELRETALALSTS